MRAFLGTPLGPKTLYFFGRLPRILEPIGTLLDFEACPATLIWPSYENTAV
jgi:hypothetical protein